MISCKLCKHYKPFQSERSLVVGNKIFIGEKEATVCTYTETANRMSKDGTVTQCSAYEKEERE